MTNGVPYEITTIPGIGSSIRKAGQQPPGGRPHMRLGEVPPVEETRAGDGVKTLHLVNVEEEKP